MSFEDSLGSVCAIAQAALEEDKFVLTSPFAERHGAYEARFYRRQDPVASVCLCLAPPQNDAELCVEAEIWLVVGFAGGAERLLARSFSLPIPFRAEHEEVLKLELSRSLAALKAFVGLQDERREKTSAAAAGAGRILT
jgi:hypothetical protein